MLPGLIASRFAIQPDIVQILLVFFAYSFIGYLLEVVVLTIENRQLVLNRGFASHMPFCIIYGFGGIFGYALLKPFEWNPLLLFFVGALLFTIFEYIVGRLQIYLFGDFWWDYTHKRFNYQGILCLQSSVGWGVGAMALVYVLHGFVVQMVGRIPAQVAAPLVAFLALAYVTDFLMSARTARQRQDAQVEEMVTKNKQVEEKRATRWNWF